MAKKVSRIDKYDASPDAIYAMLCDASYVEGKYQALGDVSSKVDDHTAGDGTLTLKVNRVVPSDMPEPICSAIICRISSGERSRCGR